jgi:G3E family GTPase
MRTLILAGFLGAGKTTVLMELAAFLVRNGKTVVILENEISSAGVDNQLLKSRGFQVRNIFAGCVCCSSAGVLCQDVHTIRQEFAPDWLIVEATGMAFPDAIQESLLRELGISASILALVDASRWKRVLGAMRQFAVSQLKGASMVLVNKIDKVGQEALRETTESVEELAPGIPVHPVCAIQPIPETVWKSLPGMEEL